MKKISRKLLLVLIFILTPVIMFSEEYSVTMAQMPVYAVSETEGVLVDLVKAIEEVSGDKLNIKLNPFASSVYLVKKGVRDIHMLLSKMIW